MLRICSLVITPCALLSYFSFRLSPQKRIWKKIKTFEAKKKTTLGKYGFIHKCLLGTHPTMTLQNWRKTISFHLLCWKFSQGDWFLHRVSKFCFDTLKANWALVSSFTHNNKWYHQNDYVNLSCSWNMSKCERIPKIDDFERFFNVGMVGAKWGFLNLPTLIPLHLCMHQQPTHTFLR